MTTKPTSVEEYINSLAPDRKDAVEKLRAAFKNNLPAGFHECLNYGMIGFVVPHSIYPNGYHCDPKLPLPFIAIASQKAHISIHHMGMYMASAGSNNPLYDWFLQEWPNYSSKKLDMGKACIRFKKPDDIPFELIEKLATKMSPEKWIEIYESVLKR